MARPLETLSTVNSFLRTLLVMVIVGGVGMGGWYGYTTYNHNRNQLQSIQHELNAAQDELNARNRILGRLRKDLVEKSQLLELKEHEITVLIREKEKLEAKMHLLKVDSRVAEISVLDQRPNERTGELTTKIAFVDISHEEFLL